MIGKTALHFLAAALVAAISVVLGSDSASAQNKRIALVIGNSDYTNVSNLPNTVNDAGDIGAALELIGFDVTRGLNLDYRDMRITLRDFAETAVGADIVFVYFAGHGIEIDNTNYLIPVNAELRSDRDIEFEAIRLDTVLSAVANVRGLKVVLVDACRNNPFLSDMVRTSATRSIGRGLGRIDPGGVLVGYAARGGTLALDGDGRNSPYAEALLEHIKEPGLELGQMFRKVRDTVIDLTEGHQEPFIYGSLPGTKIYLVPAAAPVNVAAPATTFRTTENKEEAASFEAALATGTPRAWAHYFGRFPRGLRYDEALEIEAALIREEIHARGAGRDQSGATAKPIGWLRREAVKFFGLKRSDQLAVQSKLTRLGYGPGAIDGNLGPQSFEALSNFQRDRRLVADGILDRATLRALGIEPPGVLETSRFRFAATLGKRYRIDAIKLAEPDARVHRLVETFPSQVMNYGFFEGRLYAVVRLSFGYPWEQVSQLAFAAGGQLASIESGEEDAFVIDLFRFDSLFWNERKPDKYEFSGGPPLQIVGPSFGLRQAEDAQEPAGGWGWVNGESLKFRNWMNGYPRNSPPSSRYGEYVHGDRSKSELPQNWHWGDYFATRSSILIEIP